MTRDAAHLRPSCVAIVSLGTGRTGSAAGRAVRSALGGTATELVCDGPLTIGWSPCERRSVQITARTICALEGRLHEPTGGAAALASAWETDGAAVFPGLRGEFWALLWDRRTHRGTILADQLGTRAPFWTHAGGECVVAGEARELLAALPRRPAPDAVMLAHWLQGSHGPPGRTLYAGVGRLPAGHRLALEAPAAGPARYWTPDYCDPSPAPRAELVAGLRRRLVVAVSRRNGGESASGILLSGGIDSSVVAGVAAASGSAPHAYSAVFPDHPSTDEAQLIDATVSHIGARSTRIAVRSGSVLNGGLDYLSTWCLPPTSPNSYFWTPLMQRAAADRLRVLLDGEGGDETYHLSPYMLADRVRAGRLLSAIQMSRGWTPGHTETRRLRWLRLRRFALEGALPAAAHDLARSRRRHHYAPPWLPAGLAAAWLETSSSEYDWKRLPGPRWWAFLVWAITRSAGPALVYEQAARRAAIAGAEPAHPLVDVDVVEFMLRISPELNADPRYNRPLLRDAAVGLLPEEVRSHPRKSHFDAPFHAGLISDLPALRRLLDPDRAALGAYVDVRALRQAFLDDAPPAPGAARMHWGWRLWRQAMAEAWLRSQSDPGFPRALADREHLAPLHATIVEA